MKHGKRPTVAERKIISSWGLNAENWLVVKHTPEILTICHRISEQQRHITLREPRGEDGEA